MTLLPYPTSKNKFSDRILSNNQVTNENIHCLKLLLIVVHNSDEKYCINR